MMEVAMELAAAIRRWHSGWVQAYEVDSLGRDQREALARDIVVSEDVLTKLLSQGPEAAAELQRLMRALGFAPETTQRIHPAVMRDMSIVCSACKFKRRCRKDIESGLAPVAQRYCPNTHTIKALHRERYELALPCEPRCSSSEP
jgi:hypothetical protein